jgi:hypothetical protein
LEGQDLTGLVGPASGRCALPPEMAVRDAAPLALVCDQVGERSRVASVERVRRRSELVDHTEIMPPARLAARARSRSAPRAQLSEGRRVRSIALSSSPLCRCNQSS